MSGLHDSRSRLPSSILEAIEDPAVQQLAFMRTVSSLTPSGACNVISWLDAASQDFQALSDLELTRITQAAASLIPETYRLVVAMINGTGDVAFKVLCSLTDADLSPLTTAERRNLATCVLARVIHEEDGTLHYIAGRFLTEKLPDELASMQEELQHSPQLADAISYAESFLRGGQ